MTNRFIGQSYLLAIRAAMRAQTKLTILGEENLPDPGSGLLIVSNHFSIFEIPLLYTKLPYNPSFFATFELLNNPVFGPGIKAHRDRLIFINRSVVDRKSLKEGVNRLKSDDWLVIFPEGAITRNVVDTAARGEPTADLPFDLTRPEPVELFPARSGSAWMAVQAKVPVIPIAFEGTENIINGLKKISRTEVKMHIGKPMEPFEIPAGVRGQEKKTLLDQFGHKMMQGVADLLPPKYRGDLYR